MPTDYFTVQARIVRVDVFIANEKRMAKLMSQPVNAEPLGRVSGLVTIGNLAPLLVPVAVAHDVFPVMERR
jgi:hypothetical protein